MRPLTIIMVLVVMIIFIMRIKKRDFFHVDVYDASDVKITSQQTENMSECLNLAISTKNIWLKQKFQLLISKVCWQESEGPPVLVRSGYNR